MAVEVEANGLEGYSVRRRSLSFIGFDAAAKCSMWLKEGPRKVAVAEHLARRANRLD